eukprot:TRINITY_DN545_c0_g1_i4.p1 TRINITY_DN545_c0_g1~~TRINITY_DN545_c0_g1_i4.p1  ORF type:complete len:1900 (+),score=497.76 TRINITY_DN545_c0_g1_i4:40-5739(+)
MTDNIRVAVRMRPLNARERDMGAKTCVQMNGQQLVITKPDEPDDTNEFAFDYCYDSMDSTSETYAGQDRVFQDLGSLFLESCWEGYNSTLFAYGQTGSGKSFSMMGTRDQLGVIPLGCAELFRRIQANRDPELKYYVEASYLEIYNETIQDLFNPKNQDGLKLREDPKLGVFVESLTKVAVSTYREIERLMEQGSAARTVAATKMNATSSRSHSVFTLRMVQQRMKEGQIKSQRVSVVNLVDLAGSERQQATGAEGQRLREACAINKSLSALGNVISSLADMAKGKKVFVPYRDSILTRMLQQALGGNAKTIMIAAISPAAVNYEESLSTLRYADRAKRIVNRAVVNETAQDKLIRELKEELERLREQATAGGGSGGDELRASLEETKAALREATEGFEAKLARAKQVQDQLDSALEDMGLSVKELSDLAGGAPQLVNLSADALLAGNLVYYLPEGDSMIGTADSEGFHNIKIIGSSVAAQHAQLLYVEGRVCIKAVGDARTFVNGTLVTDEWRQLQSGDRIIVGRGFIFRFVYDADGRVPVTMSAEDEWALAMKEFATARGEDMTSGAASDLIKLAEEIKEANDISDRIHAHVVFSLNMNDQQVAGALSRVLSVRVVDILAQRTSIWERAVFEARLPKMRSVLSDYLQSGRVDIPADDNPFFEPMPDQLVGMAYVPLQHLASDYAAESDVWYPIYTDAEKTLQNGTIHLVMAASSVDEQQMRRYHFELTDARGIDTPYHHGMWCRFDFPDDGELEITERSRANGGTPNFAFIADWDLPHNDEMLTYLRDTVLPIEVFGFAPAIRKEIGVALKMSLTPGSLAEVQAQLLGQQIEHAEVHEKLSSAQMEAKQLRRELDTQLLHVNALTAKLKASEVQLNHTIDVAAEETAACWDAIRQRDESLQQLQQQLSETEANLSQVESERDAKEYECSGLQEKLAEAQQQLETNLHLAQQSVVETSSAPDTVSDLQQRLDAATLQHQQSLAVSHEAVRNLELQLMKQQQDVRNAEELKDRVSKLEQQLRQSEDEKAQLKLAADAAESEANRLKQTVHALESERVHLKQSLDSAESDQKHAKQELSSSELRSQRLTNELKLLSKQLTTVQQDSASKIASLEAAISQRVAPASAEHGADISAAEDNVIATQTDRSAESHYNAEFAMSSDEQFSRSARGSIASASQGHSAWHAMSPGQQQQQQHQHYGTAMAQGSGAMSPSMAGYDVYSPASPQLSRRYSIASITAGELALRQQIEHLNAVLTTTDNELRQERDARAQVQAELNALEIRVLTIQSETALKVATTEAAMRELRATSEAELLKIRNDFDRQRADTDEFNMKRQLAQAQVHSAELAEQISSAMAAERLLRQQLAEVRTALALTETSLQQAHADLAAEKTRTQQLSSDLRSMERALSTASSEATGRITSLEAELCDLREASTMQLQQSRHETELARMDMQHAVSDERDAADRRVSELRRELQQARQQSSDALQALRAEFDARQRLSQTEVERMLRFEIDLERSARTDAEKSLIAANTESEKRIMQLKWDLSQSQTAVTAAYQSRMMLIAEHDRKMHRFEEHLSSARSEKRTAEEALQSLKQDSDATIAALLEKQQQLDQQLRQLNEEVSDVRVANARLQSRLNLEDAELWRERFESSQKLTADATREASALADERDRLKTQLEAIRSPKASLRRLSVPGGLSPKSSVPSIGTGLSKRASSASVHSRASTTPNSAQPSGATSPRSYATVHTPRSMGMVSVVSQPIMMSPRAVSPSAAVTPSPSVSPSPSVTSFAALASRRTPPPPPSALTTTAVSPSATVTLTPSATAVTPPALSVQASVALALVSSLPAPPVVYDPTSVDFAQKVTQFRADLVASLHEHSSIAAPEQHITLEQAEQALSHHSETLVRMSAKRL